MKRKILYTTVTIVLLGLTVVLVSQENDIYISLEGSDTNGCSLIFPCKSFDKAINMVEPGDVIHILKGTYKEAFIIPKSGTEHAYIEVIGHSAVLNGVNVLGDYIIISNIEVTGTISHGIITSGEHTIIQNSSVHHSVTENGYGLICNPNEDEGGWGSGIKVERGAKDIIIKNNISYENCGEGIAVTMGENVMVANNTIRDNYSVNLYIDNSSFVTAKNNVVICTGNGYLRDNRKATGIALGEEYYDGWGAQRHDNIIQDNLINGCFEGISSWRAHAQGGIEKNLAIIGNTVLNSSYQSIAFYWKNENVLVTGNIVDIPVFVEYLDGITLSENTYEAQEN